MPRNRMKKTLIYITHARIPSEKTPAPFALKTCESLARQGLAVELWAAKRHNPTFRGVDAFEYHGIARRFTVTYVPTIDVMRLLGQIGFLMMLFSFNVALFVRLRKRRDLIVYAHDLRDLILPIFLGIPTYCEIHDFYESSLPLNGFILRRLRGVIVTNRLKIMRLKERYGIAEAKMLLQRNVVDAAQFDIAESKRAAREKLDLPLDVKLVMYTGHLYDWKGVNTLAEAVRYLPEDARVYFVGGTDEDREALKEFAARKHVARITFLPHQTHERMPYFQKAADVLVLPNTGTQDVSKYETSPVKLFEYLASGTSIVASDLPSIRDIVTEKEVFFARADDPKDFARAISEAFAGDLARSTAGKTLVQSATWDERAKAIAGFIDARSRVR